MHKKDNPNGRLADKRVHTKLITKYKLADNSNAGGAPSRPRADVVPVKVRLPDRPVIHHCSDMAGFAAHRANPQIRRVWSGAEDNVERGGVCVCVHVCM